MEEKYYMWYCPTCAKEKNDLDGATYHVHGYIDESVFVVKNGKCLCGHDAIKLSMPCEDYEVLTHISTDPDFIKSMVDLHDKDVIEYNLKMSQFKANLSRIETSEQNDNNKKKCPYCGHTEFTPVRKKWSFLAGFATNKTELICNNCGKKVE